MTQEEWTQFTAHLKDSVKFNALYANGNISLDGWQWPKGEFKGLKLNGLTFSKNTYSQGITFQNCQFINCRFLRDEFENTQFLNCQFENCVIEHSRLEAVQFDSSHFRSVEILNSIIGDEKTSQTQFLSSTFDSVFFKKTDFNGVVFEKVKNKQFSIQNSKFNNVLITDMEIQPDGFEGNQIKELNFVACTILKEVPTSLLNPGKTNWQGCWIDGLNTVVTDDLMLKMNEFGLRSSQLSASPEMKSFSFGPVKDSKITGNPNLEELNFIGANVERSVIQGFKGTLMRSGLEAALTDTHLENLDFEDIEWDNMIFTRCAFKNIRARKSLVLDKTQFIDCKFENFTLDAGGTYSAKGTPFESSLPK